MISLRGRVASGRWPPEGRRVGGIPIIIPQGLQLHLLVMSVHERQNDRTRQWISSTHISGDFASGNAVTGDGDPPHILVQGASGQVLGWPLVKVGPGIGPDGIE